MIPINVELGLNVNNKIEYIPLGIFNIDKVKKDDFTIKITAYDNMSKFKVPYFSSLGSTATLTQVVNEIAAKTGVQFEGNLPNYSVKKLEGFSCREILSYVASLCAGNAIIKRNGKFTILYPTDINRDIGEGVFDLQREEVKYKVGKITCKVEDKTISKGSLGADSMELQFENPWINETILVDIYNRLSGFEYLGYTLKWQGDPSLEIGDIITYKDDKGVIRKLPIFNRKLSYDGGLDSELSAKGETKNKNSFDSSGSIKKKIDRVVTELAIVNEALIDVAYIGDLTAGNIKFDTASGTIMDLQTLLAKFVTGENGQFLNLTTDNVTISNALIKDVIAKSISVEDLKASTISTNKFKIASDNGGIEIVGATQQFKDKNSKVRIQMGQDTQGNFNFILRGEDGTTTLIDHTGIKEKAIADDLIKEKMIAENAVGEKQINYSSLVTGLNKDANTSLIQASKVAIDLTGQKLDVAFNSLKSNVDNMDIGGRNLQGNADFNKPLSGTWRYAPQFMSINEEILCDGYKSVKVLRTNATTTSIMYLYTGGGVIPAKYGEEFTMSFMYYIPEDVSQEIDGTFQAGVWFYKDGNAGAGSTRKNLENEIVKGKWIKVVVTGKAKDVDTKSVAFVIGFNKNCEVYISKPKLERGNKATDFTVAPEDTDEKIEANTTAISIAQGKIEGLIKESSITKGDVTTLKDNYTSIKATVDGINTTVASHTSSIGNLTADLSGVSGKVATVETKQATLEQNLNGFKTTVSNTYSTKTELNTVKGTVTSVEQRINTVEQKVTATAITTTISSAINAGTSSITTTQFVMDKTGFTVKNGAIKIQNKAGTNVMTSDTNGNLTITGTFVNKNYNGVDAIKIQDTSIYFYDWERNGRELGIIYSSYITDYPNVRGFSLAHNNEGYMTFGYKTSTGYNSYIVLDKYAKNPAYPAPIRVLESAVFQSAVNMQERVYIPQKICFESAYNARTPQIFKNTSDSRNILVAQISVSAVNDGFTVLSHTGGELFSVLAGQSYPIWCRHNTQVSGDFYATGSKNSLQSTDHYGERLINAYETAEYYFGDIGSGVIKDGECIVWIDDIFQECINTDVEYHVFTQVYHGSITRIERYKNYFIVHGEDNTEFSWELKAKRIGYENVRLDQPSIEGYLDNTSIFTEEDLKVDTSEDVLMEELDFNLEEVLMEVI
ncbi:hypothetical protein [Clostridium sp.]|uniref:hypothetical protein n=1 Tax=Clostridium sp. TaxID=1506 RepID=UPI001D2F7EE4|nr:hypothetical protein [Clostridium sp.]MBS5305740.1 hypothetical protein [Clostridium sp.]